MRIIACIWVLLLSFLLVQPIFSAAVKPSGEESCSRIKNECGKTSESRKEENDCGSNRCNPFMSCTSGNFYVAEGFYTGSSLEIFDSKQPFLADDNRIFSRFSECWHPPELT